MIASLSAYIQFLAAIYVTICIDNLICRRFWSPDYYYLVTQKLGVFEGTLSTSKRNRLESKIREKEHILDSRSRKRGAIMLTFCLLLLWYIGFEKPLTPTTQIARNIPIASLSILTFIALLLCRWLSRRWRYTLTACLLVSIIFALLILYVSNLEIHDVRFSWLLYTRRAITILILFPIFYQLYVNWLYSKAYIIYLNRNISEEHKRYLNSKKGLEENNEKIVDSTYDSAFKNILLKKMRGDNAMTELNDLLYEHLKVCCTPPNPFQLLYYWWKCKDTEEISSSGNESDEIVSDDGDVIVPVSMVNKEKFDAIILEKYKEYQAIKNKPSISEFCKIENIDEKMFRSFHVMVCKSSTIHIKRK